MILHTCSEAISFSRELESVSAAFYKNLAEKGAGDKDAFLSFARENERNVVEIERSYYGAISDAIEGCFAFNIDPDKYTLGTKLAEGTSYSDALTRAVEMERQIVKFYLDAAEQSKSLMADVPRTFLLVAKRRGNRESKLRLLVGKQGQ